jgi:hypothetical protein
LRDPETHLIPRAMKALQGYVADFAVFGDDYDTPDGTAVRDYIHVTSVQPMSPLLSCWLRVMREVFTISEQVGATR